MKRLLLFTATALVLAVPTIAIAQDNGQYPQDDGSYAQDNGPDAQDQDAGPNGQDDGSYGQDDGSYAQDDGTDTQDDGGYAQDDGRGQEDAQYPADDREYGFTTGAVDLRAGPDTEYPSVSVIPGDSEVQIQGCTNGWEWCDVILGNGQDRGWIAGNYIAYNYDSQPVLISEYGRRIGVPVVTFSIGNYWDSYYRYRPFYNDRVRWYSRPYTYYRHPAPRPFVGWNLRFGVNGRDHYNWNHRNNWDRGNYYRGGHWNQRNNNGTNHGLRNGNGHGRVVPMPHPIPDNNHWKGSKNYSPRPVGPNTQNQRPRLPVGPNAPRPEQQFQPQQRPQSQLQPRLRPQPQLQPQPRSQQQPQLRSQQQQLQVQPKPRPQQQNNAPKHGNPNGNPDDQKKKEKTD